MSIYRFIDAEKATYPVSMLCRVLNVSRSGYHAWKDRPPSKRTTANAALTERIREIHHRSRETYGYPRDTATPESTPNSGLWGYTATVSGWQGLCERMGLEAACEGVGGSTPPARTL